MCNKITQAINNGNYLGPVCMFQLRRVLEFYHLTAKMFVQDFLVHGVLVSENKFFYRGNLIYLKICKEGMVWNIIGNKIPSINESFPVETKEVLDTNQKVSGDHLAAQVSKLMLKMDGQTEPEVDTVTLTALLGNIGWNDLKHVLVLKSSTKRIIVREPKRKVYESAVIATYERLQELILPYIKIDQVRFFLETADQGTIANMIWNGVPNFSYEPDDKSNWEDYHSQENEDRITEGMKWVRSITRA